MTTLPARIPSGRTFGIELEFYGLSYTEVRDALEAGGIACYIDPDVCDDYDIDRPRYTRRVGWKITDDGSIENGSGDAIELVSPVLKGMRGLRQVAKVAEILTRAGAEVNGSCGFHVHVGASDLSGETFLNLVKRYAAHEAVMDSFMPESRRANENEYCRSLSDMLDRMNRLPANTTPRRVADSFSRVDYGYSYNSVGGRYYKLNLSAFLRHGTVEFRHHSGTTNPAKIVNWIVFCLNFVKNSVDNSNKNVWTGLPRVTREFYTTRSTSF